MGHPAISVLVCLVAAYALAVAIYPVIRHRDAFCIVTVAVACGAVVACLFIIPREQVVLRALTALVIVDLSFRLIDFTRQCWRGAENYGITLQTNCPPRIRGVFPCVGWIGGTM